MAMSVVTGSFRICVDALVPVSTEATSPPSRSAGSWRLVSLFGFMVLARVTDAITLDG